MSAAGRLLRLPRGASARVGGLVRRTLPLFLLPLSLIACGLASSPWLRAYPSSVLAVPLFGAAVLSVVLPFVVVTIGVRKLWQSVLIDVVGYLFFVTLVALREPLGYPDLWSGLVHGPSQILSFALPLVSPRTLLVVPVTLCWLCGAVVGECIGRGWRSILPYLTLLMTFALSYAATQRAVTNATDGRRFDTMVAGALLLCLLLMRAVQVWVEQENDAVTDTEAAQPGSGLPMRSVAVGAAIAVLVSGGAALAVQSSAFTGRATAPQRTPPIASTDQQGPLSVVAGLRPPRAGQRGKPLFIMTVDSVASRYVSIGDVDTYNGDSWSFSRTFRPSGGVVPANTGPSLRPKGRPIEQQYTLVGNAGRNPLAGGPWMPFEFRPQQIIGVSVDTDPGSGMIVASSALRVGKPYSVTSSVALRTLDQLRAKAQAGTSYQPEDLQLPTQVQTSLQPVIRAFHRETGTTAATPPVAFLQALSADLRARYGLLSAGGSAPRSRPVSSPGSPAAPPSSHPPYPAPGAGTASSYSQAAGAQPGGTSFAVVLASILRSRTATPEQYATLVALIARQLGVPAVVVTGFRLPTRGGASTVQPGTYTVTTGDAWTWVAIPIQRHGWVVLDPTPMRPREHKVPTPGGTHRSHSTLSPQATLQTVTPGRAGHAVAPSAKPSRSHPVAIGVVVAVVLAAIAALIVVALIVVMLRKRLRMRRRRGAADPRLRVVGAWQETLDVLVESGLSDTHALTNAEVAAATAEAFGPESGKQAQFLGSCANLAIFSPATRIGTEDAEAAWGAHTALRRAVRSQLPLKRRLTSQVRYPRQRRGTVVGPASWDAATRARGDMPYFPRHRARRRRGIRRLRAH